MCVRSNPHASFEKDRFIGGGGPLSIGLSLIDGNARKLGQLSWMMVDAVLSRLPFVSAGARRISPRVASEAGYCTTEQCRQWASGESRVVVRAEISLPDRSIQLFNSHVYTNITKDSDVIKNALNSGYSDSWLGAGKAEAGHTGGQQLSAKKVTASKRIDFVFSRGLTPASVETLSMQPSASTSAESILWPSDHLGVVAELK